MERKRGGEEKNIGGFDLIWDNGPIEELHTKNGYKSFLGCVNPNIEDNM